MEYQHPAQLANIVTSYCTCLAGLMPLIYTFLTRAHPKRWIFVYSCILLTGIPTVWLHSREGYRLASFFDMGSNNLLAWALLVAVTGDFMESRSRKILLSVITPVNLAILTWLFLEIDCVPKKPLLRLGEFGHFLVGEVALILNSLLVTCIFFRYHSRIPRNARGLFYVIVAMFLLGLGLATGDNDFISPRILPWHATWHIVGAFGFMTLWVFNHQRFHGQDPPSR